MKTIYLNAFINEDNDLHDLEIIDEFSSYLNDSVIIFFILMFATLFSFFALTF